MFSIQGGIGDVWMLPVAGVGNPPVPNFPQRMIALASLKIEAKGKNVNLMGQKQKPLDTFKSQIEETIEMEIGAVSLDTLNMTAGETIATGYTATVVDEAVSVPGTGPFTITVAGGANFVDDLSVVDAVTGQQLEPMGSAAANQYIKGVASTGTYTFAAADANRKLLISYTKAAAGSGRTLTFGNHQSGFGPLIRIVANCPYTSPAASSAFGTINVRCAKIDFGLQFKRDGYLMIPVKGTIFPDSSGASIDLWQPGAAS